MLTSLKYELFSVELLCSSAPVGRLIVGCWLMDVGLADYGVKVLGNGAAAVEESGNCCNCCWSRWSLVEMSARLSPSRFC